LLRRRCIINFRATEPAKRVAWARHDRAVAARRNRLQRLKLSYFAVKFDSVGLSGEVIDRLI
jgi:hypothetical protein